MPRYGEVWRGAGRRATASTYDSNGSLTLPLLPSPTLPTAHHSPHPSPSQHGQRHSQRSVTPTSWRAPDRVWGGNGSSRWRRLWGPLAACSPSRTRADTFLQASPSLRPPRPSLSRATTTCELRRSSESISSTAPPYCLLTCHMRAAPEPISSSPTSSLLRLERRRCAAGKDSRLTWTSPSPTAPSSRMLPGTTLRYVLDHTGTSEDGSRGLVVDSFRDLSLTRPFAGQERSQEHRRLRRVLQEQGPDCLSGELTSSGGDVHFEKD